jgi:phosphoglycerol transferase
MGDGLSHSWMIQRSIEGWVFENPRSGYPFGSNFLDYPGSDAGNLLALKLLGYLSGSYYAALNLYFLIGFSVVFASAFCVSRSLSISLPLSFAASLLFAFLPFHFYRLGHLFYTWYFVVPLYFYIGYKVSCIHMGVRYWTTSGGLLIALSLIFLSSFGVYYAFFGVITIMIGGLFGGIYHGSYYPFIGAIVASCFIVLGVGLNVSPNLLHRINIGENNEVAQRNLVETEIHGLKLTHLLLPRIAHRIDRLSDFTVSYNRSFPLNHENTFATLGLVGALGFILLLLYFFMSNSGRNLDYRLSYLSLAVFAMFLIASIGGFSFFFAAFVSPLIRGWNRISVFIGFGSLIAFFIILEIWLKKVAPYRMAKIGLVVVTFIAGFGIFDQTASPCINCNNSIQKEFTFDQKFVHEIEKLLPRSSAIYQLPYMPFPESGGPLHRLQEYDLVTGFLHSESLRWSFAGMKGREGDLFYRSLAQQTIAKQLDVIARLGFSGIYLDRRGFEDGGRAIEVELRRLLNTGPELTRNDGQIAFYRITPTGPMVAEGTSPQEIMKRAGFSPAKLQAGGEGLAALPRQVGNMQGGVLQTDSRNGFLIFGPYVPMAAGTYRLVVSGAAVATDTAFVDVVSEGGTVQHFKAQLATTPNGVAGILATGVVKLDAPVTGLEIRIYVTEGDRVELSRYELTHLKANHSGDNRGNGGGH